MTTIRIRQAIAADAAGLAALLNALNLSEGIGGEVHSAETVLRDGFGERPLFEAVVAESGGTLVGYALFNDRYDTDLAARGIWLGDLYVVPALRRRGVARRLLAAVAAAGLARGACSLWWAVRDANAEARAFYATLGANDGEAGIQQIDGGALAALAAPAYG